MLEFAEIMVELMLNDPFHHFLRWHLGRVGSHPPAMAQPNFLCVLDGQHLQHAGCDHGEIDKGLDCVHRIGQHALSFFRHSLQLFEGEGLVLGDLPSLRPEMIAKSAHDVLEHFERDLNLEASAIEADHFFGRHGQIRTDQNEHLCAVLDEHKPQEVVPHEIQTENRKRLCLAIGH